MDSICFVRSGWACRSRILPDGRRHILELLLPGDHQSILEGRSSDADVFTALGRCAAAEVPLAKVRAALDGCEAFRVDMQAAEQRRTAMLEERLVSLGRRNSLQRMAHLFCELLTNATDGETENGCDFPLTQVDLADLLGISFVHANRSLKTLRKMSLVEPYRRRLITKDFKGLATLAGFSADYLDAEPRTKSHDA